MLKTKSSFIFSIIILFCLSGFTPQDDIESEKEIIKNICYGETSAFLRRDDYGQRAYLTDKNEFVAVNYYTGSARGAAWHNSLDPNIRDESAQILPPFPLTVHNDDFVYQIDGDLAWVSYTQKFKEFAHGRELIWTNRENRVLRKEDDVWKIVAITTVGTDCSDPKFYHIKEKINDIGNQLIEAKELDKALKVLLLNSELFPECAHVWDAVAWAYYQMGDKENTIKYAKKALLQLPHDEFTPNWRKDQIQEWARGKLELAKEME